MPSREPLPDWVRESRDRWRSRFYTVWAVVGLVAILYIAGVVLGRLSAAIAPFIVAFIITFLFKSPVAYLSSRFSLSRAMATAAVFLIAIVVITAVSVIVSPALGDQLQSFARSVPVYSQAVQQLLADMQTQYQQQAAQAGQLPGWIQRGIEAAVASVGALFTRLATGAANILLATGSGVVTGFVDVLLGLIISFWLLKDLPHFISVLEEFAGPRYRDDLDQLVKTINFTVGGYLRGQTIASLSTGAIAGIGLAIAGVPYALLLALLTFVLNYVPYIGPFVTGLIAGVIGLLAGPWWLGLVAIGIVVAAQQVTDNLITPRVMSEQVDLHPTLVIFSLLVGGTLFGIVGLLFAIPVAATAKGLFMYYWERREHHPLSGPSPIVAADEGPTDGKPQNPS